MSGPRNSRSATRSRTKSFRGLRMQMPGLPSSSDSAWDIADLQRSSRLLGFAVSVFRSLGFRGLGVQGFKVQGFSVRVQTFRVLASGGMAPEQAGSVMIMVQGLRRFSQAQTFGWTSSLVHFFSVTFKEGLWGIPALCALLVWVPNLLDPCISPPNTHIENLRSSDAA